MSLLLYCLAVTFGVLVSYDLGRQKGREEARRAILSHPSVRAHRCPESRCCCPDPQPYDIDKQFSRNA
jgi:hypothetical protein